MLIELSHLINQPVNLNGQTVVGKVDLAVIDGSKGRVSGFQVVQGGVLKKFRGLFIEDIAGFGEDGVEILSIERLQTTLTMFDKLFQSYGSLLGVTAKTETGKRLGRVSDCLIDFDTGLITRLHVRNLLKEQIIPVRFVVSITPREVIFRDIVTQPIFDKVAVAES